MDLTTRKNFNLNKTCSGKASKKVYKKNREKVSNENYVQQGNG